MHISKKLLIAGLVTWVIPLFNLIHIIVKAAHSNMECCAFAKKVYPTKLAADACSHCDYSPNWDAVFHSPFLLTLIGIGLVCLIGAFVFYQNNESTPLEEKTSKTDDNWFDN